MINAILITLTGVVLGTSLLILLFGSLLSYMLPVYHKLNAMESQLSRIWFSKDLVQGTGEPIYTLCEKKLNKKLLAKNVDMNDIRAYIDNYSISSLMAIVSYWKSGRIKKLLKKLRAPSFILLVMAAASYLSLVGDKSTSIPNLANAWSVSGSQWFKFLSASELITFLCIIIRIIVELYMINDLMDAKGDK